MHRRSAVGRLAAAVAGLSFGEMPHLRTRASHSSQRFSVTGDNLAQSSGLVTCPQCQEMWDALELTPAGVCLLCADRDPTLKARPHSDSFWTLSPREIGRLEREIERLTSELGQAVDGDLKQWHERQRELHLLHLLRAASRQFA